MSSIRRLLFAVAAVFVVAPTLSAHQDVLSFDQAMSPEGGRRGCPPGYLAEREASSPRTGTEALSRALLRDLLMEQAGLEVDASDPRVRCRLQIGPEPYAELAARGATWDSIRSVSYGRRHGNAFLAASKEKRLLESQGPIVSGSDGSARPYGVGPVHFDDPRYAQSNATGIVDSTGRIDDFHHDEETGRLFAAVGEGGVWLSNDLGGSWLPIGDSLPTTVVSAVAYTPEPGPEGTIHVLTGNGIPNLGGFTGLGAYSSTDLGLTWERAEGLPAGILGFALEVDPARSEVVYAATSRGLWRSDDGGKSYRDTLLPTGDCVGGGPVERCSLANFVTDVVVQAPGGTTSSAGGAVVAAVGWPGGMQEHPNGTIESEANGIYRSDTGLPSTFERLPGLDGVAGGRPRLGRIELGPAVGPAQDHGYLYAIVQDAILFNNGPALDPIPLGPPLGVQPTTLNGVYVSADFGGSWTLLADDQELSDACLANRSVFCVPGVVEPGVQAWYNMWIEPDPTKQVGGVPSRILFGLEEVWQSRGSHLPQSSPASSFEVIGAYYGTADCILVATDCEANRTVGVQTTHPDQHAGIFLPTEGPGGEPDGGVRLLVGHDGGLSGQTASQIDDFDQSSWDLEQDNGLQTLLPYSAVIANDGVAYAGAQDNGHIRVDPADGFRQYETFGADGTFAAVDPGNSDYAWESAQFGAMNVTTDGGRTWRAAPTPDVYPAFVNPFVMDPLDPNHLASGGKLIYETVSGPVTANGEEGTGWIPVFDLGTPPPPEVPPDQAGAPTVNRMSAIDTRGFATYVGFCGVCGILGTPRPFRNGIATNVGIDVEPSKGTSSGWHIAPAEGLPNRYITSVAIDPQDPSLETVYVTLGGYGRTRWVPPGTGGNQGQDLGTGHVYRSTDAGRTFTDISGNLPDAPVLWVEPRGDQLMVGTDLGAFISGDTEGGAWGVLAPGQLPSTPVTSIQLKPDDPSVALLSLYGRGLWLYEFPEGAPVPAEPPAPAWVPGEPIQPTGPEPRGEALAGPFDWNSDPQGWTVETTGIPTSPWERSTSGGENRTGFAVAPYHDLAQTTLTSPPIQSPGGRVFVSWWTRYDVEGSGFDEYSLEFSRDGDSWFTVAKYGGRNSGYPAFTPERLHFHTEPGAFSLRLNFYSDSGCSSIAAPYCTNPDGYTGVYVDDLLVEQ